MNERLFSEEELREMEKRTVDRLKEAIEAGEPERAKQIAERMYNEFVSMHDLYRDWTTAMLSAIGRRFGDEVLEEIMTEGVQSWWLPNRQKFPEGPEDANKVPARYWERLGKTKPPGGEKRDPE